MQLPLALPEIMLGINQTMLLALSMIIICAMIGTRDLGQEVFIALAKADAGRGIVAGFAIAFIGIIADRLIGGSSAKSQGEAGVGRFSEADEARLLRRRLLHLEIASSESSIASSHGVWCVGDMVPVISER